MCKDICQLQIENEKLNRFVYEQSSGGNVSRCTWRIENLQNNIKNKTDLEVFSATLTLGREVVYRYMIKAFLNAKTEVICFYLRWMPAKQGREKSIWLLKINMTLKVIHPSRLESNMKHIYLKKVGLDVQEKKKLKQQKTDREQILKEMRRLKKTMKYKTILINIWKCLFLWMILALMTIIIRRLFLLTYFP